MVQVVDGSSAKPLPETVCAEMASATAWLFLSATSLMALLSLITTLPKLTAVADSVVGAIPVPLSATVCGLLPALVAMVRAPVCAPSDAGVKVNARVQLAPAASVVVQVVDGSSAKPLPETVCAEMASATAWLFLSATSLMALLSLITTLPKLTAVADSVVGAIPVPLSATVCGLLPALVAMVRAPVCAPSDAGVKVNARVQLAPAASVPVQVVDGDAAMAYEIPGATVSELMLMGTVPVFLRVTVLTALVVLTTTLPKFNDAGVTVTVPTAALIVSVPLTKMKL